MKKIPPIAILMFTWTNVNAQGLDAPVDENSMLSIASRVLSIALLFSLGAAFILNIIKLLLDYRLKSKMLDKGISESLAAQLLQTNSKDIRIMAFKWFIILTGIAVGLTLVSFFRPLGIHSVSIMAFTLALSFLAYYYYTKRPGNQ